MVVGTAADDAESVVDEILGEHGSVFLHLCGVFFPRRAQVFTEADSLGGDDVLQRTTLIAGEDSGVEQLTHLLQLALLVALAEGIVEVLAHENHATTGTTQRLMRCRGDDMGVFHRVVEQSGSDESGGVSHVDHEQCPYLVGDLAHALIVPLTAVGRATADDQLGFVFQSELLHVVVVHASCFAVERVSDVVVEDTRGVDTAAVREVAALVEVKTHEGVAGLQHSEQHSLVGLCTGVRLYIGKLSTEEFLDALDGEGFYLVHHLAAAIIAFAGQTLSIFVGQITAHSLHHLVADEVL